MARGGVAVTFPPPHDHLWGEIPVVLVKYVPVVQPRTAKFWRFLRGVQAAPPRPPSALRRGLHVGGEFNIASTRRNRPRFRVFRRGGIPVGGTCGLATTDMRSGCMMLSWECGRSLTQRNCGRRCRNGSGHCDAAGLGVPGPLAGNGDAVSSVHGPDSSLPVSVNR